MNYIGRALDNLSAEYYRNPNLAQLVLLFLVVSVWFSTYKYKQNVKIAVDDRPAKEGEYSHSSSYVNVSAMKHDMFKQMTIDLLPILVVFGIPSFIYWMTSRNDPGFVPIVRFDEVISFASYKDFMNSLLGRSVLSVMGYYIFYQYIQPVFVNKIPFF